MFKSVLLATIVLLSAATPAHQAHNHTKHSHQVQQVTINNGVIRAYLPAAKSTAAYFNLINNHDKPLILTKASIEGIGRVEIHEHVHSNGMMKMQEVKSIIIDANQVLAFKPGGYHLMAFEPKSELKAGEQRKLTLYFDNGDRIFTLMNVVSLKDTFIQKTIKHSGHEHHEE